MCDALKVQLTRVADASCCETAIAAPCGLLSLLCASLSAKWHASK